MGICYKFTVGKAVDKEIEQNMTVSVNINIQKQPYIYILYIYIYLSNSDGRANSICLGAK